MSKNNGFVLLALFSLFSIVSHSQQNIFLDRSFWKSNPSIENIEREIKNGNSPSELNSNAFDATVFAIMDDVPLATIKFLLNQKGNDVNKITHDGRTYIFWAANKGNIELMKYLLDKGAKTNVIDSHGYSFLTYAAANGQLNTKVYDLGIKCGINLKTDLNHDGANALLLAAPYDHDFKLITYFISKGLDINSVDANKNTVFNYAAKSGKVDFLKSLVSKGVKFNDNAMILAAQGMRGTSNTIDLFQYLESLKIKPTATGINGENALHYLVRKEKQMEVINYFIAKGNNVDQADNDGNTVLMNAASANSDVKVVELLVSKTININQVNKKGSSALALAVQKNNPEIVSLLISKGADVKMVDFSGENLASYLIQSYNSQKTSIFDAKLKVLEVNGFEFTTPQKNGNTLFHLAVAKNDLSLLKYIENFNIDINAKNVDGYTALHKAAMIAKDDTILKFLLANGAKKELKTEFNESAFDLASENEALTANNISIVYLK